MRFTRFYLFPLLGGVLLLLGPTTALTQPGGGGGAPADAGGRRGGGAPQDAGGGGGRRGGMGGGGPGGGGNFDPKAIAAMMFNRVANGKDFVTTAELEASSAKMGDPTAHDKLQQFLQTQNITNGQLNRDQFAVYMEQRMAERQQGGGGPGGGGPGGGRMRGGQGAGVPNPAADERDAERWFRDQDKNGDGVLEAEEMTEQLRAELSKWDTNKNGVIELDEYKEYYKARIAFLREQNPGTSQGGVWDPTQIIQPQEVIEEKRPVVYHAGNLPKELPPWFAQLDRDKDGQVGLYEWKDSGRPIEEFRAMDINGDGFITVEEALRYQRVLAKKNHPEGSPGMPTDVAVAFPGGPGGGRGQWGGMPGGGQPGGGQWGGMPGGGQPGGGQWGGMPGGGQPGGGQWGGQQGGGQQGGGRQRGGQPGGGQWGGQPGGGQPAAAQPGGGQPAAAQPGGGQPGGGRNRNRDPNADPNAGNGGGGQPGGGRGRPGGQAP